MSADEPRWVDVDPARFTGWVTRFGQRHGGDPAALLDGSTLSLVAPDGERAECHLPPGADPPRVSGEPVPAFARCAGRRVRLGLLLVRRGGVAVGVCDGDDLVASKVDSSYVQSRTAAGGWSQQRFARRRENQAKAAAADAADICVRLLVPHLPVLAALVTGGDRPLVDAVLADARLTRLRPLVAQRFLAVPQPRLAVLRDAVGQARAVRIRLVPATRAVIDSDDTANP